MDTVLNALIPVFVVAAAGFALRRSTDLDAKTLSSLNIYLFLPALVYSQLSTADILWRDFGACALAVAAMTAAMTLLLESLARVMRLDQSRRGAFVMTQFMNLGNFGLPIAYFAFGDEGLALAVIVMVCGSFLQNSLGIYFAQRSTHGALKAFVRVFRFPLIYAFVLALVSQHTGIMPVEPLRRAFEIVADAAVPAQLMILGIKLAETRLEFGPLVVLASAVRLIVGPILAVLLAWLIGLDGLTAKVFILQMSGPVAVGMAVYGVQFNVQPRYLASVVSWTFLLSLLTVAAVLYTLQHVPWLTAP